MKKLNEQKQFIEDLGNLINKMEIEIELLRNINYRYFLMHGNKIQNGVISAPKNISFNIYGGIKDTQCKIVDHEKLGITSNYQQIKKQIDSYE